MDKKKKIIISVGVIGIILACISFTLTYFRSNFSTSKKIATDIFRATYTSTLEQPDTWVPGSTTTGNFKVKNETNMSVAVRAKIEEHWYDANGNLLYNQVNNQDVANKTIGTGWGLYNGYYYYYKTLDTQNEETSNFIPTVEFANIFGDSSTCTSNGDGTKTCAVGAPYSTGRYSLVVTFEVIQADAYESEWAVNVDDNIEYNGYKITFDPNGGSVNTPSKITQFSKNTNDFLVGDLPTPVRSGYTFVGWYTQSSGGTKLISTSTINSATTLYAHWFKANNPNIKMAYVYNEETCQTGNELTCIETTCTIDRTCVAGTIIDYQVDNSTIDNTNKNDVTSGIMRFHIMTDNGTTITMQSQRNVVKGVAWYSSSDDNSKGPTTIVSELESKTSGWTNVNTLNTSYPQATAKCSLSSGSNSPSCSSGYSTYTRSGNKARLISLTEATSTSIGNCTTSYGSCKKFMSNYLYQQSSYNNTYYDSTSGNYGYWTSSADGSISAWSVDSMGFVYNGNTTNTGYGARAVVEINK